MTDEIIWRQVAKQISGQVFVLGLPRAGVALAVADICSTYHHSVRPQEWKKLFNLIGKDKDAARLLVLDYFPDQAGLFVRKKDQGRADAALVALWALDQRS